MLTKGLVMDFKREGKNDIVIISIWPATAIQSAATNNMDWGSVKNFKKLVY